MEMRRIQRWHEQRGELTYGELNTLRHMNNNRRITLYALIVVATRLVNDATLYADVTPALMAS